MQAVYGQTLCKAHHPDHAAAWKADCRKRTQSYWSKWRAAKATQGAPDQHGQNRA
jgi:hypothetical protein